jgi:ElaB/YqjD/DUF883 family membrane-anchored ribosome-binding protein
MENEDVILEQMEGTRTSLTEKLETLEKQVANSVQGATSNVAETVETVKETVEAVKDTVQDTVATVKESVEGTIDSVRETVQEGLSAVKEMFNIPRLVDEHPWAMVSGAAGIGFLCGKLFASPAAKRRAFADTPAMSLPPDHYSGEDLSAPARPARSAFSGLLKTFEPEINRLKGLALGAFMHSVRDAITKVVPEYMAPKVTELVDNITGKLGGEQFEAEFADAKGHGVHSGNGRQAERAAVEQ